MPKSYEYSNKGAISDSHGRTSSVLNTRKFEGEMKNVKWHHGHDGYETRNASIDTRVLILYI